jgi:stearoyl-CoA desaturase (delta-9 desaturase)
LFNGIYDLPWWGYVAYTLAMTHVTIVAVTIYLHRHQSHRALKLHPLPSHFFRFWLWFTTGMVTREWTAIHRKHHAKCETRDDPHSPQFFGIRRVLLEGAELYRMESRKQETLANYGHGTPDDWIEQRVYSRYTKYGIGLMLVMNFVLFGFIGITIWAIQMVWIPFLAAGVINGIGHYWGYRTFHPVDASRNVIPWGILIGGEELHNNHHAYVTSAKLSNRWYEFDIGWMYIRLMEIVGLATVTRVAPRLKLDPAKAQCDAATVEAVVVHRHEVLAQYGKVIRRIFAAESRALAAAAGSIDRSALKRRLHVDTAALPEAEREHRTRALSASPVLAKVYAMRDELQTLWQRSAASKEQLVHQLEDWCRRAEASGIGALKAFSVRLRSYDM